MFKRWQSVIAVLGASAAVSTSRAADYQLDQWNGAPDVPFLVTENSNPYWIFLVNQFTVEAGHEYITELQSIRFARANSSALYGIWSDPNKDGNPADAQLIWSTQVDNVTPLASLSLQSIPVPFVRAGEVGDGFFVGWMSLTPYFDGDRVNAWASPSPFVHHRTWFGSSTTPMDPGSLDSEFGPSIPFDTWVIRANGVPGPGAIAVLGMLPLWTCKRRRVKQH